jgi:predicted transcriptional regulator
MADPDFDRMTKDEVIAWFDSAEDISPILAGMSPATDPAPRRAPDIPMVMSSIRLPVVLAEQLDSLADLHGVRRSDLVRDALARYVAEHTSPVGRDEAEQALDVLRRVVASRTIGHPDAA